MVEILEVKLKKSLFFLNAVGVYATLALVTAGCRTVEQSDIATDPHMRSATEQQTDNYQELVAFTEALVLINNYHVDEHDYKSLIYAAIQGMVEDLDEHSSFLVPDSLKLLDENTGGHFVGIGVNVESGIDGVKVVSPIENSPADNAGIKAGDTITAINGNSLKGLTLNDAIERIRGDVGSNVQVTIERNDGVTNEVELVRGDIKVSSVQNCYMLDDHLGFLRISQFTSSTADEVRQASETLLKNGMKKLVLDLRDNPGGVLNSAVEMAGFFLQKNDLIVTLKSRASDKQEHQFRAPSGYKLLDIPVAILVNRSSASAAEVVAGALRANNRAVLIGEKTYGKASVQSIIKMSQQPDCALRLTTGYYYTPDNQVIHGNGITPDERVDLDSDSRHVLRRFYQRSTFTSGALHQSEPSVNDTQLARAREVLNKSNAFEGEL